MGWTVIKNRGVHPVMRIYIIYGLYLSRCEKFNEIQIDAEGHIHTDGNGDGLLPESNREQKNSNLIRLWCCSLLSLLGLFIGGKMTVNCSIQIAQSFGLSETLIGLTVVALATTMPELITSIMAVLKKNRILWWEIVSVAIFSIFFSYWVCLRLSLRFPLIAAFGLMLSQCCHLPSLYLSCRCLRKKYNDLQEFSC